MSKLGLNKAKSTVTSAVTTDPEPPDKRRKVDFDAGLEAWDDDFDLILTQNMNHLDNLVASSLQPVDPYVKAPVNSIDQSKAVWPVANANVGQLVQPVVRNVSSSALAPPVVQTNSYSARSVGRGSAHSRSVDSLNVPVQSTTSSSTVGQRLDSDRNGTCAISSPLTLMSSTKPLNVVSSFPQTGINFSRSDGGSGLQLSMSRPSTSSNVDSSREILLGPASINAAKLLTVASSSSVAGEMSMSCILEEREYFKTQLDNLQKEQFAKDGQIKIIREKFSRAQSELSRLKQEALKNIERRMEEKSRRELDLEQDIERLKTDLQFKDRELAELRDYLKKMERRSAAADNCLPLVPPADSNKQHISRSPSMSKFLGNFESLHLKGTSPLKTTLPVNLTAPVMSTNESLNEINRTTSVDNKISKVKLAIPNSKGRLVGPSLVNKLLNSQSDPIMSLCTKSIVRSPKSPDRDNLTPTQSTDLTKLPSLVQPASEAMRLANAGFHLLLSSESVRPDNSLQTLGLLASNNPCSVLLLPQIEDVLKTFQLQQLRTNLPVSGRSEASSALAVDESMTTGKSVLSLHNCLRRLQQLVSCCRHIRLAIIGCGDKGANCTCTRSVDAKPAGCDQKSDDINSNTVTSTATNILSSRFDPYIEKVMSKSQLMDMLISFANPTQERPWQSTIACLCLDILVEVAKSCEDDHLKRFLPLLESDLLLNCLTELGIEDCESHSLHFNIIHNAMKLLCTIVRSPDIVKNICSTGQDCVLAAVYSFCSVSYSEMWTSSQVGLVQELMISILASVIEFPVNGACLLLKSNCQCSSKVVKDLILVLRSYYDLYSSTSSLLNLTVMRKGLAVLHSLAVAADTSSGRSFQSRCAEVNTEYLTLMFDIVHLFQQQIGVSEVELNDLWSILPQCLSHFIVDEDADGKVGKDV